MPEKLLNDDDMGEYWRQAKAAKQKHRASQSKGHRRILDESGLKFTEQNNGTVLLFRNSSGPGCDFWPSTGRWQWHRPGKRPRQMQGEARSFINWYKRKIKEAEGNEN